MEKEKQSVAATWKDYAKHNLGLKDFVIVF